MNLYTTLRYLFSDEFDEFIEDRRRASIINQKNMTKDNLNLCKKHKQEWKQSEYAEHNCDYCQALEKIKKNG